MLLALLRYETAVSRSGSGLHRRFLGKFYSRGKHVNVHKDEIKVRAYFLKHHRGGKSEAGCVFFFGYLTLITGPVSKTAATVRSSNGSKSSLNRLLILSQNPNLGRSHL